MNLPRPETKMYRPLLARKVLSFDELMQRREEGTVMTSDGGDTLDLALLALQDAQSKLQAALGERDEADRRAGAAERRAEDFVDTISKRNDWLRNAKAAW